LAFFFALVRCAGRLGMLAVGRSSLFVVRCSRFARRTTNSDQRRAKREQRTANDQRPTMRAPKPAAMDSLVLSRLDVALGKSAWRMALRHGAARNLHPRCIRGEFARAGCVGRDPRRASGSRHGCGLGGLGGGDARESVWLEAARAYLSLS